MNKKSQIETLRRTMETSDSRRLLKHALGEFLPIPVFKAFSDAIDQGAVSFQMPDIIVDNGLDALQEGLIEESDMADVMDWAKTLRGWNAKRERRAG